MLNLIAVAVGSGLTVAAAVAGITVHLEDRRHRREVAAMRERVSREWRALYERVLAESS